MNSIEAGQWCSVIVVEAGQWCSVIVVEGGDFYRFRLEAYNFIVADYMSRFLEADDFYF